MVGVASLPGTVAGTVVVVTGSVESCCAGTPVQVSAPGAPRPGVGSNATHPALASHTSGQAWACLPFTRNSVGSLGSWSPGVNPTATREGSPM